MSSLYENTNTNTNTNTDANADTNANANTDKRVVMLPRKSNKKNKKVNNSITNITFRKQEQEQEQTEEQIYDEVYKSVCENIHDKVIDRDDQITFWKKYGLSEADYDAQLVNDANLRLIEKYERDMMEVPKELLEATKAYEEKINEILVDDPNNHWWIDETEENESIQKELNAFEDWIRNKDK